MVILYSFGSGAEFCWRKPSLPNFAITETTAKTQELTIDYYYLPPIFWTFRHPKSSSSSLYKRIPKMFVCPKTKTMTPTFVLHFGSQCRGNLIYVLITTVNVFLVEFDMRSISHPSLKLIQVYQLSMDGIPRKIR